MKDKEPSLSDPISPAWEKFQTKMDQHTTLPTNDWQPTQLLGYFCDKYKSHYGISFTLRYNTPPSKSYEIYRIKAIAQMLSSDPTILKDYIDYFFQKVIIEKKKRITSIALLADANVINKYKQLYTNGSQSIDRASPLPSKYLVITHNTDPVITDYGTLAFTYSIYNQTNDNGFVEKYKSMFDGLRNAGMDLSILQKVK